MRLRHVGCVAAVLTVVGITARPSIVQSQSSLSPAYAASEAGLSPQARAGKEIWFFATAFNDRFYTYSYPQRLGATIDWYKVLGAPQRKDLFQTWGAIPDPDCCIPGEAGCKARSLEETYGFPWCPGDDELLKFVGREGYRDPACDFRDSPFDTSTPHGATDQRQSACDLKFGTSTGALGLRKFPNPRFDAEAWKKLNGSAASWDGYRKPLASSSDSADSRTTRLFDGAVEPPFRIGMSCGACHIAYDPLRPPADASRPIWSNIDGLVGNQYSMISQLLGSGLSTHKLEWQLIARTRPGTVDTSALPMDTVANAGTMNAIINLAKRPLHEHRVLKWRKASTCPAQSTPGVDCWCEPGKAGKCWERRELVEAVPHILKGAEDSVGVNEAIQRVYFNIGSCAEQCWMNHIPDLRAADPAQRNYGQTPFDIGQCRRDCASFRAIEDRLDDVAAFFLTARPSDLWRARRLAGPRDLEAQLDREFGQGSVALGRQVFARACASCHSSQNPPFDAANFHATDPRDPSLRIDWLSNERPVPASRVGTYSGRAMHSNHMPSRVWDQYAARGLHERPVDPALAEIQKSAGRGYYRPPSLLSVWAHAPFMHNNAIGPELCGQPSDPSLNFYASPYVDERDRPVANPPACWRFDVSVEGRYRLFKASMEELLNPSRRIAKMFLTDAEIIVDVAPRIELGDLSAGFTLKLPSGLPAVMISSLRYKDLIQDMALAVIDERKLQAKYETQLTVRQYQALKEGLVSLRAAVFQGPDRALLDLSSPQAKFVQTYYSNVLTRVENAGHRFGEGLSEREKRALIAFLATL